MFTTGSADDMVNPDWVLDKYNMTTGVDKAFFSTTDVGHSYIASDDEQLSTYDAYFFKCHLLNDDYSCSAIYGSTTSDPCSMCDCATFVNSDCEFEGTPALHYQ